MFHKIWREGSFVKGCKKTCRKTACRHEKTFRANHNDNKQTRKKQKSASLLTFPHQKLYFSFTANRRDTDAQHQWKTVPKCQPTVCQHSAEVVFWRWIALLSWKSSFIVFWVTTDKLQLWRGDIDQTVLSREGHLKVHLFGIPSLQHIQAVIKAT